MIKPSPPRDREYTDDNTLLVVAAVLLVVVGRTVKVTLLATEVSPFTGLLVLTGFPLVRATLLLLNILFLLFLLLLAEVVVCTEVSTPKCLLSEVAEDEDMLPLPRDPPALFMRELSAVNRPEATLLAGDSGACLAS
jgi:hypothetical protein